MEVPACSFLNLALPLPKMGEWATVLLPFSKPHPLVTVTVNDCKTEFNGSFV